MTADLTHDEVLDLAGAYVLHALEHDEYEAVRRHLTVCPLPHAELEQLGGVAQSLDLVIEPVNAPPAARERILAAIARDASVGTAPTPMRPTWRGTEAAGSPGRFGSILHRPLPAWVALSAALVLVAALGGWAVQLNQRATYLEQRADDIADVMAASVAPGAEVAVLRGSGPASAAAGIAVVDGSGLSHIVVVGLPPAPSGQTYQAWQISGGVPRSAGLLTVDEYGYAVLDGVPAVPDTDVIALTLEVAGGVDAPTTAPIVTGSLGG